LAQAEKQIEPSEATAASPISAISEVTGGVYVHFTVPVELTATT
jgi:hypothetical protein